MSSGLKGDFSVGERVGAKASGGQRRQGGKGGGGARKLPKGRAFGN